MKKPIFAVEPRIHCRKVRLRGRGNNSMYEPGTKFAMPVTLGLFIWDTVMVTHKRIKRSNRGDRKHCTVYETLGDP